MTENLPVNWQEQMAAEARAVAKAHVPQLSAISLRGGRMQYLGNFIPNDTLDCIVVASIFEKNYFKEKFDPSNIKNPDCFAFSENGRDMVPHPSIANPVSTSCDTCPHSKWGSDASSPSKKGKLCKELFKMILIPDLPLEELPKAEMAVLRVPPTSTINWSNYVTGVANSVGRPPWGMLTRIMVKPHAKKQFEVTFGPVRPLTDDYLAAIYPHTKKALEILLNPYDPGSAAPDPTQPPANQKPKKY